MDDKVQAAKQQVFEEELRRIESEVEPRARELAEQWLKEEENFSKQQLQGIELERNRAENALALRIKEVQSQLSELRRQKEEARARVEKEQQAGTKEEAPPIEAVPTAASDNIWGTAEPSTPTVEEPVVQPPQSAIDGERPPAVEAPQQIEPVAKEEPIAEEKPVTVEAPSAKEEVVEKKAPPPEVRPTKKKGIPKAVWYAVAAVVLIGVGIFVYNKLIPNLFPKTINVAVMPWKSSGAEMDAIASSLAEEVANRLEYIKPLIVMGYSSSSQFARNADPARAIFDLGYTYILQGSLKNDSGKYVADVKLVDSVGNARWSQSFETSADKLPELSGNIARQLVDALSLKVEETAATSLNEQSTTNKEAYTKYLQGMAALRHHTPENVQTAFQLFQQAASEDQKFAATSAAAAEALTMKITQGWDMSEATLERAEEFAKAALNANSSLPQAHIADGKVLALQKKYQSAIKDFDDALSATPNNSESFLAKANVLIETGKYDDAVEALNHASEISPRDPEILKSFAFVYQLKGDPHEAMRYHEALLPLVDDSTKYLIGPMADIGLFPDFIASYSARLATAFERHLAQNQNDYATMYRLARLYQVGGKASDATKLLESLSKLLHNELNTHPQDSRAMVYLGLTLTRSGKFSEAANLAKKALDTDKSNTDILYKAAQIYSLQKKDETLKVLHDALNMRYNLSEIINGDFYNFHDKPEFFTTIQMPLQ